MQCRCCTIGLKGPSAKLTLYVIFLNFGQILNSLGTIDAKIPLPSNIRPDRASSISDTVRGSKRLSKKFQTFGMQTDHLATKSFYSQRRRRQPKLLAFTLTTAAKQG